MEPPWKAIVEEAAGLYYFNYETGESLWEHPTTEYYRDKVQRERQKLQKSKVGKLACKKRRIFGTDQKLKWLSAHALYG